jgi:hypothetical protein
MTIKVSRAFLKDFAEIASIYDWSESDIEECKQATREDPELKKYWSILAAAHRAGYKQCAGNGHVRLREWCLEKGLEDPYSEHFNPRELDLMSAQDKQMLR